MTITWHLSDLRLKVISPLIIVSHVTVTSLELEELNLMASTFLVILLLLIKCRAVIISTQLGRIEGNQHILKDRSTIYSFVGIPYAIPPLDNLRFAPSQLNTSFGNNTYNATSFGPACLQQNVSLQQNHQISEDCLFLNIWTPTLDKNTNMSVMIWIHGGADKFGAGSDNLFHGNNCGTNTNCIAFAENIILVTMNYRLGALGFLSNPGLFKQYGTYGGLNGIGDQITAIHWVYKYISDYGGNPNDLTVFGESAGGEATCMLMISPFIKKQEFKIKKSIVQSGACNGPWSPAPTSEGIEFSDEQLISAGYSTNINELRKQITNATDFVIKVGSVLPTIDQMILFNETDQVYSSTHLKDVINVESTIIGFNSMDGIAGWPYTEPWENGTAPLTNIEYREWLREYFPIQAELMYNYYYPPHDFPAYNVHTNASIAWYTIVGDACLICPSLKLVKDITMNTNVNMYSYDFGGTVYPFYASHAAELPFVFDYDDAETNQLYEVPWNQSVSNSMVSAWNNFGLNGVPNITNNVDGINVDWKVYGKDENVMMFTEKIYMKTNFASTYRNNVCDFWFDEIGAVHMRFVCYEIL
eukprot:310089_1